MLYVVLFCVIESPAHVLLQLAQLRVLQVLDARLQRALDELGVRLI